MVNNNEFKRWLELSDEETKKELKAYTSAQAEDAFYKDLEFGTGGLRGIIGAGTNRINSYTVKKASQGLACYLIQHFGSKASVAIAYDSRIKSDVFAKNAASVFAANGIKVYIWPRLLPVPVLSYSVRFLGCCAGVMITASHNPSKYNGYKVYEQNGCQITTEAAKEILSFINKTDIFAAVKSVDFEQAVASGLIKYMGEEVLDAYVADVKKQSVLYGDETDKNISIVYSPLNGTGLEPVTRVLSETGYAKVTVVEEQRFPDGNFPTCPYPNPEIKEALSLGLEYCKRLNADLMLATDPDCDRVGIAAKNSKGEYRLFTGNEVGLLLLDYICCQRKKYNTLPADPLLIKTIVTSELAETIASAYGLGTINVLTGFKFIGEQINFLEEKGQKDRYVFGFEESYGYLGGPYVRDKDGVYGAFIICEMFCYYKSRGINLEEKLNQLYGTYGYCSDMLKSYQFEGIKGMDKMKAIMQHLRSKVSVGSIFAGMQIEHVEDYALGIKGLPKSDVLKYRFVNGSSLVVRPSGTEPKLKFYISAKGDNKEKVSQSCSNLVAEIESNII